MSVVDRVRTTWLCPFGLPLTDGCPARHQTPPGTTWTCRRTAAALGGERTYERPIHAVLVELPTGSSRGMKPWRDQNSMARWFARLAPMWIAVTPRPAALAVHSERRRGLIPRP